MRWCLAIHKFCYPFIFLLSRTTALALVQDFNEPRLLRHQGLVMHCPFGWGSTKRDKAKKAFTTEIIFCILLLYMEVIRWWQCSITLQKDRNEQTIRMDLRLTDRLMSFWRFFFAVCVSVCTNVTGVGGWHESENTFLCFMRTQRTPLPWPNLVSAAFASSEVPRGDQNGSRASCCDPKKVCQMLSKLD